MKMIYRDPDKEEREISHFQNFVSLFKDFEIDKWEKKKPPFPDFLIFHETTVVGVELTSLIDTQMMKVLNAHRQCFKIAMEMAKKNGIIPLDVKAKFRSSSKSINKHQAAKELYDFVVISMLDVPNDYYNYLDKKPTHLQYFDWIRIRKSEFHDWWDIKIVFSELNPFEKISESIRRKQNKIEEYLRHCDTCWLLIGIDEFNAPEAYKITDEFSYEFHNDFERVFILHHYLHELVELK